jgi:hypothetical protein
VDLLNGAAAAIRGLAVDADAALSVLAVATIADTKVSTNGTGDVLLTFPTLAAVTGVVITNVYGTTGTTIQQLQVPVWCRVPGAPAGAQWMRAFSTLTNAPLLNHPTRFNAIGWGPPK